MKHPLLYSFFLISILLTSCRQNQQEAHKNSVMPNTKDSTTLQVPNSMVRNVKLDKNGNILIASFKGVFRYDGKSFTNITNTISSPSFWDVLEDRKGNLWFATRNSGAYYYNGKSFQHFTTKEGLANNGVRSVYEDKAGTIWFGTGGGVSRYDGKIFRNFTTKDGLPNNDVTTIMEDKAGKIWFGTRGEACFYDGKKFTILKNKDGKAFTNVWSIIDDKKGDIWFGGSIVEDKRGDTLVVSGGLWRYDGNIYTKVSQHGAAAIIQDKKGNIWTTGAANPNGVGVWSLLRYDVASLYSEKPTVTEIMSIKEGMLCGIVEANNGDIWFGSLNGVYRYDGKTITDFKDKEGAK